MSEEPQVVHENRCSVCDKKLDHPPFVFEVTGDGYLDLAFCSWDHATEWVNRGEPTWPAAGTYTGFDWGCLVIALIGLTILTLVAIGVLTIVGWVL